METKYQIIEYGDYKITSDPQSSIICIEKSDRNLTSELNGSNVDITEYIYRYKEYFERIKDIMFELLKFANYVKDKDGEMYANLCSHSFSCLTTYSNYLKSIRLFYDAIEYWKYIEINIERWEIENPKHNVHKGSLYGFIAEIYMLITDVEIAFTYMHRAVSEDYKIKDYITEYPYSAPSYQIVTLQGEDKHFMGKYLKDVRAWLKDGIDEFNSLIGLNPPFSLKELDRLLLANKFFVTNEPYENLVINISYYIWQTLYYLYKSSSNEKLSSFDNLNRLNKLFGMCVLLETFNKKNIRNERTTAKVHKKCYERTLFVGRW